MVKMLFSSQQPAVSIVALPNGMRDITVLSEEEFIVVEPLEDDQLSESMFCYAGNQFRTVYELTENEILENIEKYLDYTTENEPTLEQLMREQEIIDNYTLELIEGGLL